MVRKIIFVFSKYFEKKDWNIFNCCYFLERGYDVEIWSLVQIHYNGMAKEPLHIFRDYEVKYFETIDKFKKEIEKNKPKESIFLVYPSLGENPQTGYMIRHIIKQKGFRYCDYFYPTYCDGYNINERFPDTWIDITKYYLRYLKNKREIMNLLFSIIYPPQYIFVTARANLWKLANKYDVLNKNKLIYINSFDYDEFILKDSDEDLAVLKNEGLEKNKYIVFVDQAFSHHSDFANEGAQRLVTEKIYVQEICRLFDYIEAQTTMKVVIALHPKAEYINNFIFGPRKMIYGKTRILIKYCNFMVLNLSTAISYAMLYKKQIMLYTTNQINKHVWYNQPLKTLGKYLECKIINISKNIPDDLLESYVKLPDDSKRKAYIKQFVCSKKRRVLSVQLIDKCLKKL